LLSFDKSQPANGFEPQRKLPKIYHLEISRDEKRRLRSFSSAFVKGFRNRAGSAVLQKPIEFVDVTPDDAAEKMLKDGAS